MREKAVIYGTGKRFNSPFFYYYLLPELMIRYDIVGVCDKNTVDNSYGLKAIGRDSLLADYNIIITSDKYYNEICDELMEEFLVPPTRLISLDVIEKKLKKEKIHAHLFRNKQGVEIGGPSPFFGSIYDEMATCDGINFSRKTVWEESIGDVYCPNGKKTGKIIIADAVDLSIIEANKYDFCISSNNLEHIANPIRAVKEMVRITKDGGLVLIVVPNKDTCFDHNRKVTAFTHLIMDYRMNIQEDDLTHLEEILELHDYEMDPGISSRDEFEKRAINNYENRCLHHHVFDDDLLLLIFKFVGLEIIESGKIYDNYFALGKTT